jgi:hypothetical protein
LGWVPEALEQVLEAPEEVLEALGAAQPVEGEAARRKSKKAAEQ